MTSDKVVPSTSTGRRFVTPYEQEALIEFERTITGSVTRISGTSNDGAAENGECKRSLSLERSKIPELLVLHLMDLSINPKNVSTNSDGNTIDTSDLSSGKSQLVSPSPLSNPSIVEEHSSSKRSYESNSNSIVITHEPNEDMITPMNSALDQANSECCRVNSTNNSRSCIVTNDPKEAKNTSIKSALAIANKLAFERSSIPADTIPRLQATKVSKDEVVQQTFVNRKQTS